MNPFEEIDTIENKEIKLIEIWMETSGRKKNTYISGWNISELELKEHIKVIKKKNGCNGTLKEINLLNDKLLNDKPEVIKVIQLQGDHIDYMKEYLLAQNIDSYLIKIKG